MFLIWGKKPTQIYVLEICEETSCNKRKLKKIEDLNCNLMGHRTSAESLF